MRSLLSLAITLPLASMFTLVHARERDTTSPLAKTNVLLALTLAVLLPVLYVEVQTKSLRDKHTGSTIPVAGGIDVTFHEPLGVVGLITPWNFPMLMASWKIGPALAAGNTAVLKPAEITPLTSMRIGELALEAGIPEGVLNVVVGPGRRAGNVWSTIPTCARWPSPVPRRWASSSCAAAPIR